MTTFTDSKPKEKDSPQACDSAVAFASEVLRVPTRRARFNKRRCSRIGSANCVRKKISIAVGGCIFRMNDYYKLAAEGLRASACIVRRARPNTNDAVQDKEGCSVLASGSLERAISRLSQQDEDQEVKDASVTLLGDVLTHLGDTLKPAQQKQALDLLLERIQAESTKLVATRNAAKVARHSPAQVNLSESRGWIREFASFFARTIDIYAKLINSTSARGEKRRETLKDADCVSFVGDAVTELVASLKATPLSGNVRPRLRGYMRTVRE